MKYTTLAIIAALILPLITLAADVTIGGHKVLVGIPGLDGTNPDFNAYVTALYALSISIAALLAVIKIIIAGVKWMMTDVVTSKGEAKKDIQGALIGLLVVIAAVLILIVINPDITNVDLTLQKVPQQNFVPSGGSSSNSGSSSGSSMSLDTFDKNGTYSYVSTGSKEAQNGDFKDSCAAANHVLVQDYQYLKCVTASDSTTQDVDMIYINSGTTYETASANCAKLGGDSPLYDPMNDKYVFCIYPK